MAASTSAGISPASTGPPSRALPASRPPSASRLAPREVHRDDAAVLDAGEKADGDADPDPMEAGAQEVRAVLGAREPGRDDRVDPQPARAPGEVLADDLPGEALEVGAVPEVALLDHLVGVFAGPAIQARVADERLHVVGLTGVV